MPQLQQDSSGPTVLHVAQPVDGGVAQVVLDLVRAQSHAGMRALVACPDGGILAGAASAAGAGLSRWNAGREPGPGVVRETAELARIIRATQPDLVHAHSAKAGLAARLALRGRIPTVFQPHAWSFEAVTGPRARLALRWERTAARWAERVLCVSRDEQRRGWQAGIDARWAVIRNGVDTEHFVPAGPAGARRAREGSAALSGPAGVPADAPLVVCVGRLCRQKGQDVLLRAWPGVTRRIPGARLVLVGDGPARPALEAAAGPDVLFAGPADDPAPWYAAADLVVQPSRWEGMALAPLEAMSCGRPVVVSDVTGARESLPPGQASACLVPAEDSRALAGALARLLADHSMRAALGRQARRHVQATADVRRTTAEVGRLYGELLGPALPAAAHTTSGPSGPGNPDGTHGPHSPDGPHDPADRDAQVDRGSGRAAAVPGREERISR